MEHLLCNLMGNEEAFTSVRRKSFALTTFKYLMQLWERRHADIKFCTEKAWFEDFRVVKCILIIQMEKLGSRNFSSANFR